jgi:hypothetical protein
MNETSRLEGGPPRGPIRLPDWRDVLARVVAASEALGYGASAEASAILRDLEADLAAVGAERTLR